MEKSLLMTDIFELPKKKKKKTTDIGLSSVNRPDEYSYELTLQRLYSQLKADGKEILSDKKKLKLSAIQISKLGGKRIVWTNFGLVCKQVRRDISDISSYILSELDTKGSLKSSNGLVIYGKFSEKDLLHILKKYVTEYVLCKNCKGYNTSQTKDRKVKQITCMDCQSIRS